MDNKYVAGKVGKMVGQTGGGLTLPFAVTTILGMFDVELTAMQVSAIFYVLTPVAMGIIKFIEKIGLIDALKRLVGKIGK